MRKEIDDERLQEIFKTCASQTYSGEGRRWVDSQHIVEREGGG